MNLSDMNRKVREADPDDLGRQLCPALFAATKLVALYGTTSQVSRDSIVNLQRILDAISAVFGYTAIRVTSETLFLNDYRVRTDSEGFMAFQHVIDLMTRRKIGEIRFGAGSTDADLCRFLEAIQKVDPDSETPIEDMELFLEMGEVREITVAAQRDLDSGEDDKRLGDLHESSLDHYRKAVFAFDLLREEMDGGARLDTRKCKRIVEGMVDILERDDAVLIALTGMKGAGGFLGAHSTHVAILVMAMGRRIGMARGLLAKIGLAALLHDLGRTTSGQPGPDADHTRIAAHRLLDTFGFTDGGLRCVLGALHHHESVAVTEGYVPPISHRLITVADFFDSATTPADDTAEGRTVADVLERMSRPGNGRFDPDVVALLADVVGIHPRGTVVELDSGELGVVCGVGSSSPGEHRPLVRVDRPAADDGTPAEPLWIDLGERSEDGAGFTRSVSKASPPAASYASLDQLVEAL